MGRRLQLHSQFVDILGSSNVYFQPPSTVVMQYPAIVYHRYNTRTKYADNSPYSRTKCYLVTVIDRDPDSQIPEKIAELPMCTHNRFFVADNLNHDVYYLYY